MSGVGVGWADEICGRSGVSPDGCACRVLRQGRSSNPYPGCRFYRPNCRSTSLTDSHPLPYSQPKCHSRSRYGGDDGCNTAHTYPCADSDTRAYTYTCPNADSDTRAYAYTCPNADSDTRAYTYTCPNADSDTRAYTYACPNADSDTRAYTHAYPRTP